MNGHALSRASLGGLFAILVAFPGVGAAQTTCVDMGDCGGGTNLDYCNALCGGSCIRMWYDVGGKLFECAGMDCQAAAKAAAAYCHSGNVEETCDVACGGGCCDAGETCCNDGCLEAGQTCCGDGACDAGQDCCNGLCIPAGAACCADGSSCPEAGSVCCAGGCFPAGSTCCGDGSCATGQECADGTCVPAGAVPCADGSLCPQDTACASGQCCPGGFASYDPVSGFCCGSSGGGLCVCAVGCAGWCCPADTVCCTGGYCAGAAAGCPQCSMPGDQLCPDHQSCAPAGATCCGNGRYCTNGLSCMDCPAGKCCGDQSNPAQQGGPMVGTIPGVTLHTPSATQPTAEPTTGSAPVASSTPVQPGTEPAAVKKAGDGGCSAGATSGGPAAATILFLLTAGGLALVRRRRPGHGPAWVDRA